MSGSGGEARAARALACAVLSVLVAGPSAADWQFTRWRMTPQELAAAAPEPPMATSPEERALEQRSDGLEPASSLPWRSGRYRFRAFFYFAESRLAFVKLRAEESDPSTGQLLQDLLRLRYGPPEIEGSANGRDTSAWRTETDWIVYRRGPNGIAITYEPRLNDDNAGL